MLVVTLLPYIVDSILCRYIGRYFAAQYCRQRTMQISWSLLCCTILQAAYYVDMLVVTLLPYIVDSILCRYIGRYFAAQYCRHRTMQISWSLLSCTILQAAFYVDISCHYFAAQYCRQSTMQISQSLLCCTIMQAAYYVDILIITLLHCIVGSVLCRYVGRYFTAQYCRQRTMQISWSLLCCTILQAAFYVDILVITLLHNIVGSLLCRYLGHYFAAQYSRQRTIQISWSLLCYILLQAAYYVHILVVTLLNNSVGSVLCRYLNHYFAVQNCLQCSMLISCSLLCCTILQATYYLYILVITLLHNTVAAYYVDILVITLLHNIVGSVLCRYLGHYFTAPYCRQSTMQISQSLLCCTILQAAYYVDILVVKLLHNIVNSEIYRYLGHYISVQYCRQRTMQISWSLVCCTILQAAYNVDFLVVTLLYDIGDSVLCRYLGRYFAAQYCRQRTMQIFWSLICCTIMQAAYYVDIVVITLLHNTVGSVKCRYLGHYFAAQYCWQCSIQISWSLLCCTILLYNTVGGVLYTYLGHYFVVQYCTQRTMQISWSLLCCTILQAAYY